MRYQSGRLCKLEFYNFVSKKKFTIDQSLRISFEYTKSADETETSSTGEITIHGLTEETAEALGDRISDSNGGMFQTEVKCSVGYSGDPENFQTLFYATVMSNKYTKGQGTSQTKIVVSANFAAFNLGNYQTIEIGRPYMMQCLFSIADYFPSFKTINLRLSNVPIEYQEVVARNIELTRMMSWSYTGNLGGYLDKICNTFNLTYTREVASDGTNTINFLIDPLHVVTYVNLQIPDGLKFTPKEQSSHISNRPNTIQSLNEDKESKTAVVLSQNTGLLATPYLDNRNVKVPFSNNTQKNEVIVGVKQNKLKDGKPSKKPPKEMTVNRRFLSVRCLLNPAIKPHSMVKIVTGINKVDGLYRARNCKYIGDTHVGSFEINMEIEDTGGFNKPTTTVKLANEDDVEVIGN